MSIILRNQYSMSKKLIKRIFIINFFIFLQNLLLINSGINIK